MALGPGVKERLDQKGSRQLPIPRHVFKILDSQEGLPLHSSIILQLLAYRVGCRLGARDMSKTCLLDASIDGGRLAPTAPLEATPISPRHPIAHSIHIVNDSAARM
jgi:hypothetical protein